MRVFADGRRQERPDVAAREEPLEIRVDGRRLAVTMRTPIHDFSLTAGFLLSEGIITGHGDIAAIRYCDRTLPEERENVVDVTLAPGVPAPTIQQQRQVTGTSACGVCGTTSIDQVRARMPHDLRADQLRIRQADVFTWPDLLAEHQAGFAQTGGLHAAALLRPGRPWEVVTAREDVGRHNALDKVIGDAVINDRLPLAGHAVMVSSRASYELVHKCALASIPVLAAVSAPSTLAIDLARETGLTLIGFLRDHSFVVYTEPHRLVTSEGTTDE